MGKKDKKNFIVVLVIVIILAIVLLIVITRKQAASSKRAGYIEGKNYFFEISALDSISYNNGEDRVEFIRKDGLWVSPITDRELNQATIGSFEKTIVKLGYNKQFMSDNLDQYGLDKSAIRLVYTYEQGKEETLLIGDSYGDGCYCMLQNDEHIYTVDTSILVYLNYGLADYIVEDK